jgi:lactate dehydrogenase-like 2-hydroxyacid dehydrogenase
LTPHSAGIAPEVVEAGLAMAVSNVKAWISGDAENVVV